MIQIPKKEYEELLEEVGLLRNPEIIEAIKEDTQAKEQKTKTWELNY